MIRIVIPCLLLGLSAALESENVLEASQITDCTSLRGNGHCDKVCLLLFNGNNDGGDCTYQEYCEHFKGNYQCDVNCYDVEMYDEDCKCPRNLLSNGRCNVACIWSPDEAADCHCTREMIGDGHCDEDCMGQDNYFDGGDCFQDRY